MNPQRALAIILLALFSSCTSQAGQIFLAGIVTQSTFDGTGPASNTPSLNSIVTGQQYTVALDFTGDIPGAGSYNITAVTFAVPSAPAMETSFGPSTLTVTQNGANHDLSLLACLTTGSGCASSNQLTANFRILAPSLNAVNAPATGLDPPHPLDLLEDDGVTDIQGTITQYSYVATPEPNSAALVGGAIITLFYQLKRTTNNRRKPT